MIVANALRQALADYVDTEVNTGAGTANIKFETSADAALATCNLSNPAFGAATAAGTISLDTTPAVEDTSASAGTVAQASLYDRDGTKLLEMTVGTTGTEIDISSTTIGAGDTVTLTSLDLSVPAS